MRGRKIAAQVVLMLVTGLLGWATTGSASASTPIAYSGRATAVTTTVAGQTALLADTGEMPSTGGSLEASSPSGIAPILTGDTLHASTIGHGDRTRSEASLGGLLLSSGVVTVTADLVMSRSWAKRHGSGVQLGAVSHVDNLAINGLPVVVTGQPNQTIPLVEGQLVINEQSSSTGGTMKSITVNALHLTLGDNDAVLGTSRAGATAGSASCSGISDFASGGGFIQPPLEAKRTFGFVGGIKNNGSLQVHLVFVNHETNERVKGQVAASYFGSGNTRTMLGNGEADGQPTGFALTVQDNGEPGTSDAFTLEWEGPAGPRSESGTLGGGNIQIHPVCG